MCLSLPQILCRSLSNSPFTLFPLCCYFVQYIYIYIYIYIYVYLCIYIYIMLLYYIYTYTFIHICLLSNVQVHHLQPDAHLSSNKNHPQRCSIAEHHRCWLVVWNMFFLTSIYWECHHPNRRTPSFFRGVGQPPTWVW